ncbi:hypothetical protein KC331_g13971 [Hortaea werneckii]|nr:hypothetical protein KC331_g13971 [Hortaea werneckii]KAI7704565.1 hypothetical protein KC353_g13414 [Hortaea werneckii]
MSWLSPKRRRTTGNLKTLPNGDQQPSSVQPPPATSPSNDDSVTVNSNALSLPTRARTQPTAALHGKKIPNQSTAKRPTTLARPLSQPLMSPATLPSGDGTANGDDGNGNLFYAYARKCEINSQANDLQSRYLLTFANASIANEWWSLLQEHFHDVSRPSPQLFSFKDPELLSKAWKNTSFAHLKSKWMYISFSDTASTQLGGAAQGIIPIQDAAGNLLGGGAPASSGEFKQAREETREVRNEMSRLEERFERMMGAIEKNGDRMASLLMERQEQANAEKQDRNRPDQSELSSHLEKITELLAKNSEYVQGLEKRQASNEKAIREELKKLNAKPKEKGPDMLQLLSHLDKVQKMMEQSLTNRKDGSMVESQRVQIDLSPLTERLTKVQEAVEQNSALVRELLEEGANSESRAVTPFWAKNTPTEHSQQHFQPQDLSPLTEHLERIHQAIEQQSNHMQALVGFASGGDEESGSAESGGGNSSVATAGRTGGDTAERSLAPLGEHLEQIYNAIEQGNTQAQKHWVQQEEQQRSQQPLPIDLKPLLEAQHRTRLAVEAGNKVDMGPLVAMFDGLIEHMRSIREDSRSVDSHLQELIRKQNELTDTFAVGGSRTLDVGPLAEKLDQVNEHLEILREWSEFNAERWQEFVDARGIEMEERRGDVKAEMGMLEGKFDTLSEHVQALRTSSNTSSERLHELLRKPQQELHTSSRPPSASSDIDLTPLNDRLTRIHDSLERQVVVARGGSGESLENNTTEDDPNDDGNEIQGGRRAGVGRAQPNANLTSGAGDPKFLITALTSHLSKIQAVTDTNAQQLSRLLHTFSPPTGVNKPQHQQQRKQPQQPNHHPHDPGLSAELLSDPPPSSRHITAPAAASAAIQQDHRLEATHSQVRELMAGQREMIDAVRELAKSIRAEKGESCEHVVIPPPRKVGRKVVGFVYDGKGRGGG